jgi:two-component system, NtrC family, sensor kinase
MLERVGPTSRPSLRKRPSSPRRQGPEAVACMAGGIAHDLNNLFMIVSGNVDLLRYEVQSEKAGRLLDTIERMTQRGRGLTEQLLSFARSRAVDPDVTDIGKAVEELSGTLKHCLRRDIGIEVQVPDAPCFVTIDRGEFELAALNLAVNARDAMPKGGMFRIIVTPQGRQPQRKSAARSDELVAVQFSDTGLGIPAHLIARVFEPFFTTKEIGKGTGLGLSQVYEFARQAGGYATVSSLPKAGTTVTIYLRRVQRGSCSKARRCESALAPEASFV